MTLYLRVLHVYVALGSPPRLVLRVLDADERVVQLTLIGRSLDVRPALEPRQVERVPLGGTILREVLEGLRQVLVRVELRLRTAGEAVEGLQGVRPAGRELELGRLRLDGGEVALGRLLGRTERLERALLREEVGVVLGLRLLVRQEPWVPRVVEELLPCNKKNLLVSLIGLQESYEYKKLDSKNQKLIT